MKARDNKNSIIDTRSSRVPRVPSSWPPSWLDKPSFSSPSLAVETHEPSQVEACFPLVASSVRKGTPATHNTEQPKPCASAVPWPAAIADFVLLLTPDDLPSVPFVLRLGVTVVDASRFLESLKRDIATGPEGPRAMYGGIQSDLGCLVGLLNQDASPTGSHKEPTS